MIQRSWGNVCGILWISLWGKQMQSGGKVLQVLLQPSDAEGSAPVLHLKLSLWLPSAEPEELQGKVTLIPLLWFWCLLTSAQGGDSAAIYRLLGFPCCFSLPCNLNLPVAVSKWFAASILLRAMWIWNKNWNENLFLFMKETDYIQHDQTIKKKAKICDALLAKAHNNQMSSLQNQSLTAFHLKCTSSRQNSVVFFF